MLLVTVNRFSGNTGAVFVVLAKRMKKKKEKKKREEGREEGGDSH